MEIRIIKTKGHASKGTPQTDFPGGNQHLN